jgi:hypothetical protein
LRYIVVLQLPLFPALPPPSKQVAKPEVQKLAWAAGFLDGEGCIHIAKCKRAGNLSQTYRLGVSVTQNDREALVYFQEAVGISAPIYATKRAANHRRQCYTLNYTGHAAKALLSKIKKYLKRKKKEAEVALEFWVNGFIGKPGNGRKLNPELIAAREHYYILMRNLK